ncbi:hypothetical protein CLAFUW4_08370 [Fulvia fulva]|uniref:Uncharacterized protein n=1 Tax=Passalora fulva TaxID=5499 RepID=A0A9Q8P6N1_PASFU|nr:uncharacterized protein CLAFUR5_08475 [Fulvia fulva]KAK4629492.1 hypothetical protein CLAFUR4_08375 [Fulvia fulva]KAK4630029.1 hypothetical protein CLAFUR0_08370 [Fulvia fulva]UJO15208.1 hypothetical protein CLAFUR5_08475 [Fulvia fulva]WPV12657.1 hypothetical protein CLAFUW4_08370 [Fulvia fulva]WPV27935.1 hypothetical protein CLAFUW7_08370 [Fulvia fulva]
MALTLRLASTGSSGLSEDDHDLTKSSLNRHLTNIGKEVSDPGMEPTGEIRVGLTKAKEASPATRVKRIAFMRSGIQAMPRDQADLVEAGLVTGHAVMKSDGRLVLQLRDVTPGGYGLERTPGSMDSIAPETLQ